jgi:hypothetical protein
MMVWIMFLKYRKGYGISDLDPDIPPPAMAGSSLPN